MSIIVIIFLAIIGAGILLCFLRMLMGPTASDRAVAVDTITTTVVALLVFLGFIFIRYYPSFLKLCRYQFLIRFR